MCVSTHEYHLKFDFATGDHGKILLLPPPFGDHGKDSRNSTTSTWQLCLSTPLVFSLARISLASDPTACRSLLLPNSSTPLLESHYSDSVWHCFVFDPLRVVRAKLFRIVHSSVTLSFIRGAWRGSCDTSLPRPIISLRLYRRFGPVLRSPYVRSFHYLPLSCKPGPKTV